MTDARASAGDGRPVPRAPCAPSAARAPRRLGRPAPSAARAPRRPSPSAARAPPRPAPRCCTRRLTTSVGCTHNVGRTLGLRSDLVPYAEHRTTACNVGPPSCRVGLPFRPQNGVFRSCRRVASSVRFVKLRIYIVRNTQ